MSVSFDPRNTIMLLCEACVLMNVVHEYEVCAISCSPSFNDVYRAGTLCRLMLGQNTKVPADFVMFVHCNAGQVMFMW